MVVLNGPADSAYGATVPCDPKNKSQLASALACVPGKPFMKESAPSCPPNKYKAAGNPFSPGTALQPCTRSTGGPKAVALQEEEEEEVEVEVLFRLDRAQAQKPPTRGAKLKGPFCRAEEERGEMLALGKCMYRRRRENGGEGKTNLLRMPACLPDW